MLEVVRTQIGIMTYLVPTGPIEGDEGVKILATMVDSCVSERDVNLIVDLSKVPVMSGLVLESFLDFQDQLARLGGSLKVVKANPILQEIFIVTGVGDYIAVIEE